MRTLVDPSGFPPKSRMLPLGVTTVAALLRGSFRAAPGNHVRGAAHKLAPTNNGATPIRHRDRNSSFVFIVVGPAIWIKICRLAWVSSAGQFQHGSEGQ